MLPSGEWIDYETSERYEGPQALDAYPCPLEKLPVFVRAGAIIPMWPVMNFVGEKSVSELPPSSF